MKTVTQNFLGVVTATTFKGSLTGNSTTATKLAKAIKISLTGGVTGSASFNGSQDISIAVTAPSVTDNTKLPLAGGTLTGNVTTRNLTPATNDTYNLGSESLKYKAIYGTLLYGKLYGTVHAINDRDVKPVDTETNALSMYFASKAGLTGTGTDAPFVDLLVLNSWGDTSGGKVNALAFDKSIAALYHYQAAQGDSTWGTAHQIAYTTSNVASATKASSADKLTTARTIGVSGVTGTAQSFDGSKNIVIPITAVPATLLTGTASINTTGSAAKLTTARKISLTGGVTGSASFDGSANISIETTIDSIGGVTTQETGLTCDLPLNLHGQYTEAQCQKAALDYWLGYDSSSQSKYGANTETHDTANHRYKIVIRDYDTTRTMDYFYVDEWTLEVTSGWD